MPTLSEITAQSLQQPQGAEAARNKLAEDLDTFLTLLTTQLKYQDPLSPMDSTEFTNQLVQFASVEQNIAQNENLEELVGIQRTSIAASTVNYIGTTIQARSNDLPLQDGQATYAYQLPRDVSTVTVTITDSTGKVVHSVVDAPNTSGTHQLDWDGQDELGLPLPDGTYTVNVTAISEEEAADGEPGGGEGVEAIVTVYGTVTGVAQTDETSYLAMGDTAVDINDVLAIRAPEPRPAGDQPDGADEADGSEAEGDPDDPGAAADDTGPETNDEPPTA